MQIEVFLFDKILYFLHCLTEQNLQGVYKST